MKKPGLFFGRKDMHIGIGYNIKPKLIKESHIVFLKCIKCYLIIFLMFIFYSCNKQLPPENTITKNTETSRSVFEDSRNEDPENLRHIQQKLVAPPQLPEHEQISSGEPVVVDVRLEIKEMRLQIAPDASIWALTYNGSVPGPLIVVHKDDYVQLTLVNAFGNTLTHNIDFHAATGSMGGGDISLVAPGQEVTIRFKAIKTGVYVYHCAPGGTMVPLHVLSGMNGAIMVLPREGLKDENGNPIKYDKAYYIAEQDYYIPKDSSGKYKNYETPAQGFPDMLEVFKSLKPTHIIFNGVTGSLTGDNALTSEVGEKVLFITSQANRDSRIHLIGGHADLVWLGGSFNDKPVTNYESWNITAGSAVAALYQFREPGKYVYLNHNLIEAFLFGAMAEINVKGKQNDDLMFQINKPRSIK